MSKFTFGIIDANWIIMRDKSLLSDQINETTKTYIIDDEEYKITPLDENVLRNMFLTAIMRYKRMYDFKYCILCWDKSPYYHKSAIESYKSDRFNSTEEIKDIKESLKDESMSDEEKANLLQKLAFDEIDSSNFWKTNSVKKDFIEYSLWGEAGFHSICKRGYEADQLAMYISKKISDVYVKDSKTTAVLITADKDWVNFQLPGIEFMSAWNNTMKTYSELEEGYLATKEAYNTDYPDAKVDLDMYSYGILNELAGVTHNFAYCVKEEDEYFNTMSWNEYYYRILNEEPIEGFLSYPDLLNAYKAMNIFKGSTCDNGYCKNIGTPYIEDLEQPVMTVLSKCSTYNKDALSILLSEYPELNINLQNYNNYIKDLKEVK